MILALDPSLAGTGFCYVKNNKLEYGVIKTKRLEPNKAVELIYNKLQAIIEENDIQYIVKEGYAYAYKTFGLIRLVEVGGVIRLLAAQHNIKIVEVAPITIKKIVAHNIKAKKKDIINLVNKVFDIDIDDDNIADAIAIYNVAEAYLELCKDASKPIKGNLTSELEDMVDGMRRLRKKLS